MAEKILMFFKSLRWPNLLFIALTQYTLHQFFLKSTLAAYSLSPVLHPAGFWALCFCTMLLAGGANMINDYFDIDTDRINRPGKLIIGEHISKKLVLAWYFSTQIIAILLGAYVTFISNRWNDFWILPACIAGLYYYSYQAKSLPIIGNIMVAAFCGVVILIVYYAEIPVITQLRTLNPEAGGNIKIAFTWFGILAFLSNWWREITKDMEDLAGDQALNIQTFVVKYGIRISKVYGGLTGICLFVFALYFFVNFIDRSFQTSLIWWITILIPIMILFIWFLKADSPRQFRKVQKRLKLFMLSGFIGFISLMS